MFLISLTFCIYLNSGLVQHFGNAQKIVSSDAILPSYDKLHETVNVAINSWAYAWNLTSELTDDLRINNLTFVRTNFYAKVLRKLIPAHAVIKSLDWDIRFRRKPSGYLDILLNIHTIEELNKLSKYPKEDKYSALKLRWLELSSIGTQMERFYTKRIRDIINGGTHMKEIINSFYEYKTFIWSIKPGAEALYDLRHYSATPALVMDKLYMEDGSDVFQGLKKLHDLHPKVLIKNHFDPGTCETDDPRLYIEPNGTDLPFYLLFFISLVDIKEFMIRNLIQMHHNIFFNEIFTNETDLVTEMKSRVQLKINMFDAALGKNLIAGGPMYPIREGVAACDPFTSDPNDPKRNFTLGVSYEKLTNFIKVFVSPEQELHKSGTCRITCDLLDVTYSPCGQNDTDCQWERERECLLYKGRCDKFKPPCSAGNYKCQNSSGLVSVCPSNRPDRLYEYIESIDPFAQFHFGPKSKCQATPKVYNSRWKMEEDVLMSTPHFCEVCTCYCFEPLIPYLGNETTRHFSLRLAQAKLEENRILVGIKFHRIEDQIHIAIADAPALPGRNVNVSSIVWRYPEYEKDPIYIQRFDKDMRTMNLDDIATPAADRIVTGVNFYKETYLGKFRYNYIGLEIMTHQLDPEGKIVPDSGLFRRNGNGTVNRQSHLYLPEPESPDDPIKAPGPSLPDSTSNQYVVFVGTSLNKDAAQSTIPYLDSQPVISADPSWLRGIGIFHKGKAAYGGFLGLKLIEHRFH